MFNHSDKIIFFKKKINFKRKNSTYVLFISDFLIYPGNILYISITNKKLFKLFCKIYKQKQIVSVFVFKKKNKATIIYNIGIISNIIKISKINNSNYKVLLYGLYRCKTTNNKFKKIYSIIYKNDVLAFKNKKYKRNINYLVYKTLIKENVFKFLALKKKERVEHLINSINNIKDLVELINYTAVNIINDIYYKYLVFRTFNIVTQSKIIIKFLLFKIKKHLIVEKIKSKVNIVVKKKHLDGYLTERINKIHNKIGENSNCNHNNNDNYNYEDDEIDILYKKSLTVKLSKEAREKFDNEIIRLREIGFHNQEYSLIKNYLSLLLNLPWEIYNKYEVNLDKAEQILNESHYSLNRIKNRILEYLSILKLNEKKSAPIICLVGPPGVGKTSLVRSISRAMSRKYVKMSLGGLHDESEIRGHRRTYMGAMPGRIIQCLNKVGTSNPIFLLDEIDKMGVGNGGDPSYAMLEVLDPEQNKYFYDNYLEVAFDLSNIMFIATANNIEAIDKALLDRMEVIKINGYTIEEKIVIAKKFIIPNLISKNGLKNVDIFFSNKIIKRIISNYTLESGIRNLTQLIDQILRYVTQNYVTKNKIIKSITKDIVLNILGPNYSIKKYEKIKTSGVSIGLAWTKFGGDIIYIESVLLKNGRGKITMTGNIGKIMGESIIIAIKYIRSHYKDFKINPKYLKYDIHVHVPEGATPKDGPSAGIAVFSSLLSSYLSKPIKKNIAMTGEITLRGKIIEVGGIKEKVLAAKRLLIKNIVLPYNNKYDIKEIDSVALRGLKFYYIKKIKNIVNLIF